jgi:hypothetical protein
MPAVDGSMDSSFSGVFSFVLERTLAGQSGDGQGGDGQNHIARKIGQLEVHPSRRLCVANQIDMKAPESPIFRVSIFFRENVEPCAMRIPYPDVHAGDVM